MRGRVRNDQNEIAAHPMDLSGISTPSYMSLQIQLFFGELSLADATGFLVERDGVTYLVTNRHNLRGRRNDNDEIMHRLGSIPDTVEILHNAATGLGQWKHTREALYAEQRPLWFEHPVRQAAVDVVALPLTQ